MSHAPTDDKPSPPRGAAKPPPPTALRWGVVGSLHRVEPLATLPGQTGVVRLLPNTIRYTKPPLDVTWAAVKTEPGRFEMAWPGNPATARTLEDVGADLRKLRATQKTIPASHPLCRELDAAVFALVDAARKLASQGWGAGLLTPGGTVLSEGPNGAEVAIVDLGFTWTGEFGDPPWDASPGRPDWLVADRTDNPASLAWDRPPVEQQFAAPTGSPFLKPTETSSLRTVARVIAWALTGRPSDDVPHDLGPVWNVLYSAVEGEITTFEEFADRLRVDPPSTHFAEPPLLERAPAGTRSGTPTKWLILLAVLLLAGTAFLALYLKKPEDVVTGPTGTTPTNPGPVPPDFQQQVTNYNQIPMGRLLDRLKQLVELAKAAGTDPNAGKQVAELRAKLFADWVDHCEKQLGESANAANRADAGHQLRQLVDEYRKLHEQATSGDPTHQDKERAWLDHFDGQAAALGWPR